MKEGPQDFKKKKCVKLLISGPQIGWIIWTSRGGCEEQILAVLPGDSDSANWGSTVSTATVHAEVFHLPLQIYEQTGEGWKWQLIVVNKRQGIANYSGEDVEKQELLYPHLASKVEDTHTVYDPAIHSELMS